MDILPEERSAARLFQSLSDWRCARAPWRGGCFGKHGTGCRKRQVEACTAVGRRRGFCPHGCNESARKPGIRNAVSVRLGHCQMPWLVLAVVRHSPPGCLGGGLHSFPGRSSRRWRFHDAGEVCAIGQRNEGASANEAQSQRPGNQVVRGDALPPTYDRRDADPGRCGRFRHRFPFITLRRQVSCNPSASFRDFETSWKVSWH